MPMHAHEIEELILKAFPDAEVTIEDLRGMAIIIHMEVISSPLQVKAAFSNIRWYISLWKAAWAVYITRACASDKSTRIIFEQHSHIRQNNKESSLDNATKERIAADIAATMLCCL